MDVPYFLVARYAEQSQEGTLNVLGAGLCLIQAESLPYHRRTMFIAARVTLDREDIRDPHALNVKLFAPGGELILETGDLPIPHQTEIPENHDYLHINFALGFTNIVFLHEGEYSFQLLYDNEVIKSSYLRVETASRDSRPAADLETGESGD